MKYLNVNITTEDGELLEEVNFSITGEESYDFDEPVHRHVIKDEVMEALDRALRCRKARGEL